jgi:DNA-binding transcriptional LysR family regulator
MTDAPHLFAAFAEERPDAALSFRGLPYPRGSLASWLADVDVALCHSPTPDPEVQVFPLWAEKRFVVAATKHPLARRSELGIEDVLDATYVGSHPGVDPIWAGFWRLDDHRGEPAQNVTADRTLTLAAAIANVACSRAITTVPAAVLSLLWRRDVQNPLVRSLAAVAKRLIEGDDGERIPAAHRDRRLRAVP